MNVTTVGTDTVPTQRNRQTETGDATAFSQELKKQLTPSKETKKETTNEDVKDDDSQSDLTLDGEHTSQEKDDEQDFIIVPMFLRFDTHTDPSKTVLTNIHINEDHRDSTKEMVSLTTLASLTADSTQDMATLMHAALAADESDAVDMTVVEPTDSDLALTNAEGESSEQSQSQSVETVAVDKRLDHDNLGEMNPSDKAKTLDGVSESNNHTSKQIVDDVTDTLNAQVKENEGRIDGKSAMTKTSDDTSTEGIKLAGSKNESPETPVDKANEPVQKSTTVKTPESASLDRIDKVLSELNRELTRSDIDVVKTVSATNVKETDAGDDVVFDRLNLTQPQQSTKPVEQVTRPESTQTIPHVRLEESPEIIQDLMMTVSAKESGDKVYQSRLTLTPETLGQITVELTSSDEGLTGKLVFDTDEAKQWVESHFQQLKTPLELNGIKMNSFDFHVVKPQDPMQTANFNFSQQSDQSKREQQGRRKQTPHASGQANDDGLTNEPAVRSGHGVSYYA